MKDKPNRTRSVAFVAVIALALGVGGLVWPGSQPASAEETPSPLGTLDATARTDWGQATQASAGIPVTASHVQIQARLKRSATTSGHPTLSVRLHIDDGWHVNANPASLDFLIPTSVAAKADGHALKLNATYPPGIQSDIRLGDTTIKVYEDNTTIQSKLSATAATSAGGLQVSVTAQACNDKGLCLSPSVIKMRVTSDKK